jgi:hypothetical protein
MPTCRPSGSDLGRRGPKSSTKIHGAVDSALRRVLQPKATWTQLVENGIAQRACKLQKNLVAARRLELLTSTVSIFQVALLPTTYRSLETAEQRGNTRKPKFLQVILQARFLKPRTWGFKTPNPLKTPFEGDIPQIGL